MKVQLIAVILSALILAGCSTASPAAESSESSSYLCDEINHYETLS